MPKINAERLLQDLKTLREYGRHGTGVIRQALSPIDVESRHWLQGRMQEAGLDASIDGIGSVIGRSRNAGKALLIGSHTDTQPTGGWLDGAMGVLYGLEVARALAEDPETADLPVDVASWIDEEGAFFGLLGSLYFCGRVDDEDLTTLCDAAGRRFIDAVRDAGLEDRPRTRLDADRYLGYLEAHIEQGPYLEEQGNRIGVVTSIVGIRNYTISFQGEQNHAGTTPMARRKDAGRALTELASAVHAQFPDRASPTSVWTIGEISLEPGAPSIVPGRAQMTLQFRDGDEQVMDGLSALATELVERANAQGPVRVAIDNATDQVRPATMDDALQEHLQRSAEVHAPDAWIRMPSAAGHDAQALARCMPSAMLFVPSIRGISHAFEEDTDEADIALGCQVLATAVASILRN